MTAQRLGRALRGSGRLAGATSTPTSVGSLSRAVGHALLDPAEERAVGVGVFLEAQAAAVLDGDGGLPEEQAFLRGGGEDAPAAGVLDDRAVVGLRGRRRRRRA